MKLPIITVPNPILRQISKRVQKLDNKTVQFISDLGETLVKKDDPPGVGLSAIQVATPLRVFYTYLPIEYQGEDFPSNTKHLELRVFINPTIVAHSDNVTLGPNPKKPLLEGCLSIPSLYGPVYRYQWVEVEYETIQTPLTTIHQPPVTEKRSQRFSGFTSRVIQHEYDHLDGILFTDYIVGKQPSRGSFADLENPLFFDDTRSLIPISDPKEIIKW